MEPLPRFNRPELRDLFKHWCLYRCSHKDDCDMCSGARECIRISIAWMIRTLYDRLHRRHAGSNIVATHQGEMTPNEAFHIHCTTPRTKYSAEEYRDPNREIIDYSTARARLSTSLEEHFPGISVEDLGPDLPLVTGHYTPLMHADTLYKTLQNIYHMLLQSPSKNPHLENIKLKFMLVCMHICSLVSFSPDSVWKLWSQGLSQTTIILFNSMLTKC